MAGNYWRFVSAALLSGVLLAGCGGGDGTAATVPGNSAPPPSSDGVTTPTTPDTGTPSTGGPSTGSPTTPVTPGDTGQGVATLQWNAPTEFTDGTLLPATELAGFTVYHGNDATNLARVAEVDAKSTSLTIKDLAAGTHYFAVAAVSASGEPGELSEVQSKTVM